MLVAVSHEIEKAIQKEKRAYKLYAELSKNAPNYNVQTLLILLSTEELKHESLLREALRAGSFSSAMLKIQVRHDDLQLRGKLNPNISLDGFRESLEFAIKRENASFKMYEKLESQEADLSIKELFSYLKGEEARHEMLLRNELHKL